MRGLLACLFIALAGPSFADTIAVYESKAGRMTVEIAADGDFRSDIVGKPGAYMLNLNGKGFIVAPTPNGLVVDRVEDMRPALEAFFEKRSPGFKASMKGMEGASLDAVMQLTLVPGDDIIVQGRKGTPFYTAHSGPGAPDHISGKPPNGSPPVIVVSKDPELAPLGIAMARQFQLTNSTAPWSSGRAIIQRVEDLLKTGAPLEIYDGELTTVSHDPIPPSRFELPAAAESREDLIKRLDTTPLASR